MIQETTTRTIFCKHCGSATLIRFGTYKGNQRYYCKDCKRKIKDDNTSFHTKKPVEWQSSAVDMYFRGSAISDIQAHLKAQYNYSPSNSIIYKWINKYTDLARKQFRDIHPQVGDVWISDETMLDVDGNHKVWFYDIIDRDTRFLLASRVTLSRTTKDAEMLMRDAEKCAGKKPKEVLTDHNYSYINGIPEAFEGNTDHIIGTPFSGKDSGESTSKIERFHSTLKDRTKVFRAFRDVETLIQFTDGWLVYYNYFRPHTSLNKTPAEEAKIDYSVKNWKDLADMPVSKQSEIDSHKTPVIKVIKPKVSLEKAFRRKREPNGRIHQYEGESIGVTWERRRSANRAHGLITPKTPRISKKTPSITKQHYSKRGGGLTRRSDI